jgi:hypothetical protein
VDKTALFVERFCPIIVRSHFQIDLFDTVFFGPGQQFAKERGGNAGSPEFPDDSN